MSDFPVNPICQFLWQEDSSYQEAKDKEALPISSGSQGV